jgi:hypothetical protein
MLGISIDIANLAIAQMDTNAAATRTHIAGGGFDFSAIGNAAVLRIFRH